MVSVIFPIFCYLKLFGWRLKRGHIMINVLVVTVSILMAFTGTLWSFLPSSLAQP
jgi:vesicular inhibitory amino acid transporter